MTIRELNIRTLKKLASECEAAFTEWTTRTSGGRQFGTHEPLKPEDIFRYAFSKGSSAILSRIDSDDFQQDV